MKSQIQLTQFIIFFLISISIFTLISTYLFSFYQSSEDRILSYFRNLISSYTSGFIINTYTNCKYCNYSAITYGIPLKVLNNFHEIGSKDNLIYIKSVPIQKQNLITVHNLNFTTRFSGVYSTAETISFYDLNQTSMVIIFFNKTEGKFKIGR
jgi:hypothetical protein